VAIESLTVEQLKEKQERGDAFVLLDVRGPDEFEFANLGGTLIPLQELPERLGELDPKQETIVLCHHGMRSLHAAHFLVANGFTRVTNLQGGIDQWSIRIDGSIPRY
jgi:rhodanese-related sulfurtransferase